MCTICSSIIALFHPLPALFNTLTSLRQLKNPDIFETPFIQEVNDINH